MAYEAKTKPTASSVAEFIAGVEDPQRRADAEALCALLEEVSGEPPAMWGTSIIGFGSYHYRYASGHEGDAARIGFSPRKAQTVVYVAPGFETREDLVGQLGKVKTGKSCLYINRLDAVDLDALRELAAQSLEHMRQAYPD